MEHRLPICDGKKSVKHVPRRFAPNVMKAIKAEIERLLNAKFTTRKNVFNIATLTSVFDKNRC